MSSLTSAADLARALGIDPKRLRAWLRARYPEHEQGSSWRLTTAQVEDATAHFRHHAGGPEFVDYREPSLLGTAAGLVGSGNHRESAVVPSGAEGRTVVLDDGQAEFIVSVILAEREWSQWRPFFPGWKEAPRTPGVYLIRDANRTLCYVGMAGLRSGKGLRGRLAMYGTGRSATGGFGGHAFDRALADPVWVRQRLEDAAASGSQRAHEWVRAAIKRVGAEVAWTECTNTAEARQLEAVLIARLLPYGLWNSGCDVRPPGSVAGGGE